MRNLFTVLIFIGISLAFASNSPEFLALYENSPQEIALSLNNFSQYAYTVPNSSHFPLKILISPQKSQKLGSLAVGISNSSRFSSDSAKETRKISSFHAFRLEIPAKTQQMYVFLHCLSEKCQGTLRLVHTESVFLRRNAAETFIFSEETADFLFTVPRKPDFSRLLLMFSYKFRNSSEEKRAETVSFQGISAESARNSLNFSSFHVFSFENRENSKDFLCFDCNASVSLGGSPGDVVEVELFVYESRFLDLTLDKLYVDFVGISEANAYVFTLPEAIPKENADFLLVFRINSWTGEKKRLTITVDAENPSDDETFAWKTSSFNDFHQEEDVVVSSQDLQSFNFVGRMYFLKVSGAFRGVFSLFLSAKREKLLPLLVNVPEFGALRNEEIALYEVEYWENRDSDDLLELSVTMTTGHISIYGRKCREKASCGAISLTDIHNKQRIDYQTSDETRASLRFRPDCAEISPCFFTFAVKGNGFSSTFNKYELLLRKNDAPGVLLENECRQSAINHQETQRFLLKLHEITEKPIISVTFFLNTELEYWVSREFFCESQAIAGKNCEKSRFGGLNVPVIFEKERESLDGSYFLTVFGTKSCDFLIFAEVLRESLENPPLINLLEGKFFRYFLSLAKPKAFFEFLVDYPESLEITINVHSNDMQNIRLFLTNDNTIPGKNSYFLSATNGFLTFQHSSNYETLYKVALELREIPYNLSTFATDFLIMYSTEHTIKHLELGHTFFDALSPGKAKKFVYLLDRFATETVIFTKHAVNPEEAGDFLVIQLLNSGNDQTNSLFQAETGNLFEISSEYLQILCEKVKEKLCPVYILLRNRYYREIRYTLQARAPKTPIFLTFGKEHLVNFAEKDEETAFLYVFPRNLAKSLNIYLYSLRFSFDVYISLLRNDPPKPANAWSFPNKSTHFAESLNKVQLSIELKSQELSKCWPFCAVLLTVFREKTLQAPQNDALYVIASEDLSEIAENRAQNFALKENHAKFFEFSMDSAGKYESLLADVANLQGISEIYAKFSENRTLPDPSNYDFYSLDGHLAINLKENASKSWENARFSLYFAVFCLDKACEGALTVRHSDQNIEKIAQNRVFQLNLKENETKIYEYFHYSEKKFAFKYNSLRGDGDLVIKSCFRKEMESCLRNTSAHFVEISGKRAHFLEISEENGDFFCTSCSYLLVFQAKSAEMSGVFAIVKQREFLSLEGVADFRDEVKPKRENYYVCKASETQAMEISLQNLHNYEAELYASRNQSLYKSDYEYFQRKTNASFVSLAVFPREFQTRSVVSQYVYIIVYAETEVNYTISCRNSQTFQVIREGNLVYQALAGDKTAKYVLFSGEIQETRTFSLTVSSFQMKKLANFTTDLHVEIYGKSLTYQESAKIEEIPVNFTNKLFTLNSDTYFFEVSPRKAAYFLTITNNIQETLNFLLLLQTNSQEITLLPFDIRLPVTLPGNHSAFFETFIPRNGLFVLDFYECAGKFEIFAANSLSQLKNKGVSELNAGNLQEFEVFPRQTNVKIMKVRQGPLFLRLDHAKTETSLDFSKKVAQLSSHFYDNYQEIPQNRLILPYNGEIDWFANWNTENNTLNLSVEFFGVRCIEDCEDLMSLDLRYRVIFTVNECGILQENQEIWVKEITNEKISREIKKISMFESLEIKEIQRIAIAVTANIHGLQEHFNEIVLYYRTVFVEKPSVTYRKMFVYSVSVTMIAIICILSVCLCYFYGGYRNLMRKIKNGMKMVRQTENPEGTVGADPKSIVEMRAKQLIEDS